MATTIPLGPHAILAALVKKFREVPNRVADVSVDDDGRINGFTLNGFSKSGTVEVKYAKDILTRLDVKARYGEKYEIMFSSTDKNVVQSLFNEFVNLAYSWWYDYYDSGYTIPNEWKDDLVKAGLAQEVITYIPRGI